MAQRETQHGLRWWLGELSAWGAIPKNRGLGALGEEATALAQHSSGMAAVCGSTPTQKNDGFDAAAWLLKPKVPGAFWFFDYEAEYAEPHRFAELPRDCAFAGDTLVMVGEILGDHEKNMLDRDRLFLLEFDTQAKVAAWTVASGDLDPQSYGTAVTVDDQGRYYIGGYVCGATCNQPIAELRAYAPGGNLLWRSPISAIPNPHWAPHDLAWSPAGYAVVALGGTKGQEFAFTVRAYTIDQLDPLWIYSRQDNAFLHLARAVSVGPYGQIAAGGLGMTGYPAVAYIGG